MKTTVSYYASEKLQKEMIEAGKKGEREQTTILEIQPTSVVYKEIKISPTGEATLSLVTAPYKTEKKSTVDKWIYRIAPIKAANTEVRIKIENEVIKVGFNAVKECVEYEYEEAEKYVDDKTRYGKKLMLDKEPTLLDIEKIFSTAMIEEGEDWKTKMGEAETILEKKIEKKTMEGWVEKEKVDSIAEEKAKEIFKETEEERQKKAKEEKEYIDFLEKWAEENGTALLKARIEDGYQWKDLCKAEIGGKIINEIEGLSMLEEMGDDYNIMDDWSTPTLEAIQIAREVKEKIKDLEDKKGRSRNNPKRKDRKENNGGMD